MTILRKARGVLGMALTWGLAWVPLSIAFLPVAFGTWEIWSIDSRAVIAIAMEGFFAGILNGAAFAIVLAAVERRRSFSDLRPGRIAANGALAGGGVAAIMLGIASIATPNFALSSLLAAELALFLGFGAVSGAASFAIARRGTRIEAPNHLERLPTVS